MRDFHVHYTGSLPREYLYKKFLQKENSVLGLEKDTSFQNFSKKIDSFFSKDFKKNRENFFKLYKIFQELSKPKELQNYKDEYSKGCFEIAKNFYNYNIPNFDIIAGPCSTIDLTYQRLLGMIEGFSKAQKEISSSIYPRIRLTFIRDSTGKIKNFSEKNVYQLFQLLEKPFFSNWIIGFDISGEEYPKEPYFKENIKIINLLNELKNEFKTSYEISVHAGENINTPSKNGIFYEYFENLAQLNISRISHGTFLWFDLNKDKEELLKLFAKKSIQFDLCPTANLLLTPIKKIDSIPIELFNSIGLSYSFNRDNPSIFNNINVP